jgi:hypothetical protein
VALDELPDVLTVEDAGMALSGESGAVPSRVAALFQLLARGRRSDRSSASSAEGTSHHCQ